MKRNAPCTAATFFVAAALAACTPSTPQQSTAASAVSGPAGQWSMYQFAPHHNAVIARPGFKTHWSFDTKAKINGGLAVVGDTVLLDTFDKEAIALDARTGKLRWRTPLIDIAMTTPVVAEGLVYIGTGGSETLDRNGNLRLRLQYAHKELWGRPGGDEVIALSLKDGKPRWRFRTVGEDMPSPLYDRGRIIFANGDWHAYALRAANGSVLWRQNIDGISTMASAMPAANHIIVAACADGIRKSTTIALNRSSGAPVWESPYGHCDATVTYGQNKIFTGNVEPTAMKYVGRTVVAALAPQSGKPIWTYRSPKTGVWTTLASDESAIAGTYDGGTYYQPAPLDDELLAFNASSGKLRWAFRTSGPVKMSPVIKNGRLYVGDTTGVFYEIDANTGRLLKATPYKKPFSTSPPVIVGDTMFIVNGESVYAFDPDLGQ